MTQATRADLEAFIADLLSRWSPATASTRYKQLQALYRLLEDEEEIAGNPMARMTPPIVPDKPVPVVPDDALRRLLAACAGKSFEARRDTAMITFLLDTGAAAADPTAGRRHPQDSVGHRPDASAVPAGRRNGARQPVTERCRPPYQGADPHRSAAGSLTPRGTTR